MDVRTDQTRTPPSADAETISFLFVHVNCQTASS